MSSKQGKFNWAAILILTTALTGLYFVSARTRSANPSPDALAAQGAGQSEQAAAESRVARDLARRARVRPRLRDALKALGDRLEKPGKERLTLSGTLRRAGETQGTPFVAVYQQPGRLRFQKAQGQGPQTITFNGQHEKELGKSLTAEQEALVELLVYDTPDGFFSSQMDAAATRFLGSHFRADDGSSESYAGPYYDIYQVTDLVKVKPGTPERTKLFFLNSDTQLLEIVRYQTESNGNQTEVEVQLGDWQKTEGQMIPRRLVRLENNMPVFTLTITSAAVGPEIEDGAFAAN